MMPRKPRIHLVDLVLLTVLVAMVGGPPRVMEASEPHDWTALSFCGAFGVWYAAWLASRAGRFGPECVECGRRFMQGWKTAGPPVCPECRWKGLSPAGRRREMNKNLAMLGYLAVVIVSLVCSMIDYLGAPSTLGDMFARLLGVAARVLKVAGLTLAGLGFLFVGSIVFAVARDMLTKGERHALARARKVAETEGEERTLGPIKLWYSGPVDPTPMVAAQEYIVRDRFAAFTGETIMERPPLRLLVFHERRAFMEFHREGRSDDWNIDASFGPGVASMTTEVVACRIFDLAQMVRSMLAHHGMVASKLALSCWLQTGVGYSVAGDGDGSDRLNRRMLVAIERGSALGVDLFSLKTFALMAVQGGWDDPAKFARWDQVRAQSRSLVEYLGGPDAPEVRRRRFRAFFRDLARSRAVEEVFRQHFGHGFDALIASWRAWVLDHGPGEHAPPPPDVEEALANRLIPLIGVRSAKYRVRIHAIREMGRNAYLRGANALIALLDDPGDVPRAEVVWAMESISGLLLGDDPARWSAWWDGLALADRGAVA